MGKKKTKKKKDLDGFKFLDATLSNNEQKKTEDYKTWKEEVSAFYSDKVNALKEELQDAYQQAKQTKLPDYPIFIAIADDIGYDATGKKTNNNELDFIGNELTTFITEIENNII